MLFMIQPGKFIDASRKYNEMEIEIDFDYRYLLR